MALAAVPAVGADVGEEEKDERAKQHNSHGHGGVVEVRGGHRIQSRQHKHHLQAHRLVTKCYVSHDCVSWQTRMSLIHPAAECSRLVILLALAPFMEASCQLLQRILQEPSGDWQEFLHPAKALHGHSDDACSADCRALQIVMHCEIADLHLGWTTVTCVTCSCKTAKFDANIQSLVQFMMSKFALPALRQILH